MSGKETFKEIGRAEEVHTREDVLKDVILSVGIKRPRPPGRHITTWAIDDPIEASCTEYPFIVNTIEEFIRRDNERLAQEDRASSRASLLDTVASKALRNIR
jgi:hypothetical protein